MTLSMGDETNSDCLGPELPEEGYTSDAIGRFLDKTTGKQEVEVGTVRLVSVSEFDKHKWYRLV